MVVSLNKVNLIGNVGKDPEIRSMQDGREVASFSLATSESWKDKNSGEKKERTEWHRVAVFSQPLVNIIKNHVKKGSRLFVEGSLHTRKWTDQSGAEKYTTEIVLQPYNGIMMMLDARHAQSFGHAQDEAVGDSAKSPTYLEDGQRGAAYTPEVMDDEIPF